MHYHFSIRYCFKTDWKVHKDHLVSIPPSRDTSYRTRLFKTPSRLAFNSFTNEASTASQGNLFQCPSTLIVNNFFFMSNLSPLGLSILSVQFLLYELQIPAIATRLTNQTTQIALIEIAEEQPQTLSVRIRHTAL